MRKLTLLLTVVVLSVFLWSCGGNSGDKQSTNSTKETKDNTAFSTKEGMTKNLKAFNFDIPDGLTFKQMKPAISNRYLDNTGYRAIYKIENSNQDSQDKLNAWFSKQFNKLKADGWKKIDYRENVKMMGSGDLYSTFSMIKQKEGGNFYLLGCSLNKDEISISAGESNPELTEDQL